MSEELELGGLREISFGSCVSDVWAAIDRVLPTPIGPYMMALHRRREKARIDFLEYEAVVNLAVESCEEIERRTGIAFSDDDIGLVVTGLMHDVLAFTVETFFDMSMKEIPEKLSNLESELREKMFVNKPLTQEQRDAINSESYDSGEPEDLDGS
jgi:hypothetical protein